MINQYKKFNDALIIRKNCGDNTVNGNSTIAFNLFGLVIGIAIGVFGFMASVKSKARADGVAEGRLQKQ